MKKRLFKLLPAAAIALTAIVSQSAVQGAESDVPVESYQLSDGSNCFLVPLQADSIESESEYVDVVALVDLSAAQLSSSVRQASQDALYSLVENLPKNARVQIYAVSNETEPVTDGFLSVDSADLQKAIASLKTRDALGAADQRIDDCAFQNVRRRRLFRLQRERRSLHRFPRTRRQHGCPFQRGRL